MDKLKKKFKKSSFIVNKIYLFLIFIGLTLEDATLGFYYFIMSLLVYGWITLTSKVPIHTPKTLNYKTYTFKKTPKKDLKLDLWYPDKFKKSYPLVYFCHGGGWISGFRNQPNNVSWCRYLAAKGFVVASIDYRYGYKNTMDDILSDYSDGLTYLKNKSKKLNIDTNNIVLMGLSAGGHLSLLYSAYNSFSDNKEKMKGIKGVVAYYAPSDLKDIFTSDNKSLFAKFATKKTLKGTPTELKEIYDYYSPINWVSNKMVPCLIVHGKLDNTVPFQSSVKLIKKLDEYNVKHTFLVHKKGNHSFDTRLKDYSTVNILDKTVRFIKKIT
jgi:acetyl esterase/lipase